MPTTWGDGRRQRSCRVLSGSTVGPGRGRGGPNVALCGAVLRASRAPVVTGVLLAGYNTTGAVGARETPLQTAEEKPYGNGSGVVRDSGVLVLAVFS